MTLLGRCGVEPADDGRGERLYSLAQVGVRPGEAGQWSTLLGIGWHQPLGERLFLDTDVAGGNLRAFADVETGNVLVRARVIGGVKLVPGFAVYGGPTFSLVPYADEGAPAPGTLLPVGDIQGMPAWYGFTLGVRI